jgi:hypothetical protein
MKAACIGHHSRVMVGRSSQRKGDPSAMKALSKLFGASAGRGHIVNP